MKIFKTLSFHQWNIWARLTRERGIAIGIPYIWLGLFFLIPFLLVLKISLSETALAIPPFHPLAQWSADQILQVRLHLSSYGKLIVDPFYAMAFLVSVKIAFVATLACLVIGYPMAYAMTQVTKRWRSVMLMLIILPFWTSFLVRVYAWIGLLSQEGIINNFLLWLGLIQAPLPLLYNSTSVVIGIVYCYLPFMILPIYAVLDKIDPVYLEAAHDLGCRPWRTFWRVTIPLSYRAIIAGCVLVFIPAIGEFVIPELLGAPETIMIGRVLWAEFFNNRDWPLACALAVVMLAIFVVPIMVYQRLALRARER